MFARRLLSSFALVAILLAPALAQTSEDQSLINQQEKQQKALEMKKELERKTLALLDEVISSAVTLKLPENRALVLASAADLLWTRDEKRARLLFKDAINSLNSVAVKLDDKMSNEQRTAYWRRMQQRREILQMVAKHDADMALELLRASRSYMPQPLVTDKGPILQDEETRLEQSLATQVAANDPKRALQMAEDGLKKGLSTELLSLLVRLNDKDSELAGRFAGDIINKLHSENLSSNREAMWMAVLLLRMGIPRQSDGASLQLGSYNGARIPFKLDESQLRDLLELVTNVAASDRVDQGFLTLLPSIMPEVEKYLPERAQALRRRIADSTQRLDSRQRLLIEYEELIQRGSVEALLEAAAKTEGKTSEMLYEQAAWKTLTQGDAERAKQIISDNIRDSAQRDRILESFEQAAIWNSVRKEKIEEARKMIARLKSKEQRAGLLAQLAWSAAIKKDNKLALELLNEALPLVNLKPRNDAQLYTLLQVVRAYALADPNKAFEMIESLVDQANDLLSAASVLSGFLIPPGTFQKGELVLSPGYSQISAQFRQFGKELAALALLNFERTKAAADKFQRNDTRIMARLFIAQGVLTEQLGSGVALYESGIVLGN